MSCLSESEVNALKEALDDEFKALATYDRVIADFGPTRPFLNIRDSEARHIDTLLGVFRNYGLTPPKNSWPDILTVFRSLHDASQQRHLPAFRRCLQRNCCQDSA